MTSLLQRTAEVRAAYQKVASALPWLDASVWPDESSAFPQHAEPLKTPCGKAIPLDSGMAGVLRRYCAQHEVHLLRYSPPQIGVLQEQDKLLSELASAQLPLVILHTDIPLPEIGRLARSHPNLPIIIESGPLKILYHLEEIEQLMLDIPNLYLCTYNLCNWLGLERLCEVGLASRLIYGSHHPNFNPAAAMGPIVMGRLSWQQKCAIAGNNLRRLLGWEAVNPLEQPFIPPPPFVIDAHAHNISYGFPTPYTFRTPDPHMLPDDWLRCIDEISVERMLLMPAQALMCGTETSAEGSLELQQAAPERFSYLEIFHPRGDDAHQQAAAASLRDRACVGLKIHPSVHRTFADDPAYEPAYRMASAAGKPILTHSWEDSATNPHQVLSHPDRFRKHLERYPQTTFVLGHAGGRPSTIESVTQLCSDFPHVYVDISGDYFHNGLIDCLSERISPDKILYGSDANWIDPRCTLAPVLTSALNDEQVLKILRTNAMRVFQLA